MDTKNNNQVVEGKENIQPSAPIRVTVPISDGMNPDNMKLIHVLGDGTREELPFDYKEKDMTVTFLISLVVIISLLKKIRTVIFVQLMCQMKTDGLL